MKKRLVQASLGIGLVLAVLVARCHWGAREAYQNAEEYLAAQAWEEAILQLDHAIHWYYPGNPYVARSVERLWKTGEHLESANPVLALLAYDSLRGGIFAVRSFYQPYGDWLPRVNEKIARLRGAQEAKQDTKLSEEEAYKKHGNLLQNQEQPHSFWVVMMGLGFLGWVGSVFGWIWFGFDSEGKMQLKQSWPWWVAVVASFALWVGSLLLA